MGRVKDKLREEGFGEVLDHMHFVDNIRLRKLGPVNRPSKLTDKGMFIHTLFNSDLSTHSPTRMEEHSPVCHPVYGAYIREVSPRAERAGS